MVDENMRTSSKSVKSNQQKESRSSNKMPAATNNNEKTASSESATAKRRRSLFSVLFQKSNKASEDSESAEKAPAKAKQEKMDMKSEISKSDIVLVRAAEAKCVEATIESMVPSDSEGDQRSWPRLQEGKKAAEVDGQQQQHKNSFSGLMRRRGAKLKHKRRDQDADSYVLDLNDQLELEKLRISSSSSSSEDDSELDTSLKGRKAGALSRHRPGARREISPADATWRTNQNYIPCDSEKPALPPPRPPPPTIILKGASDHETARKRVPPVPPPHRSRQKSPLLQEFLTMHRIDPLAAASSDEEDETRGSSCDSLSYLSRLPIQSMDTSLGSSRGAAASRLQPTDLMSESDRRLYHWRKLAERSVTMWQVPQDSSCSDGSLNSDDDGLELMNCDSPVLVCYCSDDTSCSSVELIWSRPQLQARQRQQNEMRRRDHLNLNSSRDSFVSQQFNNKRDLAMSPRRRTSGSVSPRLVRPMASCAPARLAPNRMLLQANNNNNNNNNNDQSCTSLVSGDSNLSGSNNNSDSWRQKPAILELAKPSRARDRRIGARRKSDAGQARRRQTQDGQRDLCSRASDEWHPNPLFGPQDRNFGAALTKNSSVDLTPSNRASLRRGQSVELLNRQQQSEEQDAELSKSNRFKSFLARIKKLESSSVLGKSSEPVALKEESEDEKKKSVDDEDLDRFSANESFDANERAKRHRWSLRMRSPFASHSVASQTNNAPYLGHHLINLDKRIKSNVSSLKNHLHDTGKRASVLADQLITSIKDTTKEQLISAATGISAHDRYDTLPNSFASPPNRGKSMLNSATEDMRAKQFALIYMHQQSQATGQPVITKQPTASGAVIRQPATLTPPEADVVSDSIENQDSRKRNSTAESKDLEIINIEEIMAECERQNEVAVEQNEKIRETEMHPMQVTTCVKEAVDTCQTNAKISEVVKPKRPPPPSLRKRFRPRKTRRQINVAAQSDDDDNQGSEEVTNFKTARRKYSLNEQFYRRPVCEHRCQNVTY